MEQQHTIGVLIHEIGSVTRLNFILIKKTQETISGLGDF